MTTAAGQTLLLSIDFEDWNQIVDRHLAHPGWDRANAAFPRQVEAMFALLEEIGARATFFVLGMTARNYPSLVAEATARGHELASHGYAHRHVYAQTPAEFRSDLERSVEIIHRVGGTRPLGYRAPMYSLTRDCVHALETLADLGFSYDSSQFDARQRARTIAPPSTAPFLMRLPSSRELWEVPLPTVRLARMRVPVGGGSYWRVLPGGWIGRSLARLSAEAPAALYFHPYEFGNTALQPTPFERETARHRVGAVLQRLRYNPGRRRVAENLRALAPAFRLHPYHSYLASIRSRPRPATLSREGIFI